MLVREYVQNQLEVLGSNRGEYLIRGVTIAALRRMRPSSNGKSRMVLRWAQVRNPDELADEVSTHAGTIPLG